jgi:chromosome partitioning protein
MKNPTQKESLLKKTIITKIEEKYDIILLDCAPTESVFTTAAYLSSDYILVPVKPEYLSTVGLPLLVRSLEEFRRGPYSGQQIDLAGIVFNQTTGYSPEESKSKTEVKRLANLYGWYVFNTEVNFSRSFPKGAREGKPIFYTSYSRSKPANLFHEFANELATRINL